ncbi:hypothetical protein [Paenibacillus herberti]|uniref:hypothetical protein n=1 Tax=Paenibacillus herberti TaxID=1619309 RepID=UPI001595FFEF|nr:hypothetical protein [Paenibacillus herberti]
MIKRMLLGLPYWMATQSEIEVKLVGMGAVFFLSAIMVVLMIVLLLVVTKKAYSKKWDEE